MIKKIRRYFLNYIPLFINAGLLHKIPFLYNFFEIKPNSAVIMITNRCNLKCVMCKQWREVSREELSTEDWERLITDLKKNGIRNIHFTGGEPLLRQDLSMLIKYSSQQGLSAGVTTNGLLLDEEKLGNLIDAGLCSIAVSVDALDKKYEDIRGMPNSFIKLKSALSLISEAKKKFKIKAYINFVLMKNTTKDFKDVKDLADKLELPIAICLLDKNSSIFEVGENKDKFWFKDEEDFVQLGHLLDYLKQEKAKNPSSLVLNYSTLDLIAAYFKDPAQRAIPCISSQERIFIDPYGNILGGCLSMGNFGNIKDASLTNLLRRKKYRKAKKNMFYKNCSGCSCGYFFNIRYFPPLFVKDCLLRTRYFFAKND